MPWTSSQLHCTPSECGILCHVGTCLDQTEVIAPSLATHGAQSCPPYQSLSGVPAGWHREHQLHAVLHIIVQVVVQMKTLTVDSSPSVLRLCSASIVFFMTQPRCMVRTARYKDVRVLSMCQLASAHATHFAHKICMQSQSDPVFQRMFHLVSAPADLVLLGGEPGHQSQPASLQATVFLCLPVCLPLHSTSTFQYCLRC
jgi:hypothetical protein